MKEQSINLLAVKQEKDCQDNETSTTTQQQLNRPSGSCGVTHKPGCRYQVFLGGSCNPTTWRHTAAIPLLTKSGITYYNPQVDDWKPEMVQLEAQAKSCAEILFFVIDKQTRSTVDNDAISRKLSKNASLTAVALPAPTTSIMSSSSTSSMTCVCHPNSPSSGSPESNNFFQKRVSSYFPYSKLIKISGEYISHTEFVELRRARLLLQDLVLNRGIPIFFDTKQALLHVVQCLKTNANPKELAIRGEVTIGEIGEYKAQSACMKVPESLTSQSNSQTLPDKTSTSLEENKNIYLCLIDGDHSWWESKAIPWFNKNGISCNHVANDDETTSSLSGYNLGDLFTRSEMEDLSIIRSEICAIENSHVLLFVITNKCRGLSIMLLAAHYISLGRRDVVLCIQYLEEPCIIGGETLSKTAVADYNRGRIYLYDHAKNSNVPVFNSLEEALECCGTKCKINNLEFRA